MSPVSTSLLLEVILFLLIDKTRAAAPAARSLRSRAGSADGPALSCAICEETTPSAHAWARPASLMPFVRTDPKTSTISLPSSTRKTSSARPVAARESKANTAPVKPTLSTRARHAGMMLPSHGSQARLGAAGARAS